MQNLMEEYLRIISKNQNIMLNDLLIAFMQESGLSADNIMLVQQNTPNGIKFFYTKKETNCIIENIEDFD